MLSAKKCEESTFIITLASMYFIQFFCVCGCVSGWQHSQSIRESMHEPTDPSTLPPIHPSMRLLLLLILCRTVGGGKAYSICPSVKAAGYTLTTLEVYLQVNFQKKRSLHSKRKLSMWKEPTWTLEKYTVMSSLHWPDATHESFCHDVTALSVQWWELLCQEMQFSTAGHIVLEGKTIIGICPSFC